MQIDEMTLPVVTVNGRGYFMDGRLSELRGCDNPHERLTTPWGEAQSATQYGEGLVFVSTASHGGLWLSEERYMELLTEFPQFVPFNRNTQWLEEDCDFSLAPLLWPEEFSEFEVCCAVKSVRGMASSLGKYWVKVEAWLRTTTRGQLALAYAKVS